MKNAFSIIMLLLFTAGLVNAQDPAKDLKKASRLLGSYTLDPSVNKADLAEAKNLIDGVLTSDEFINDTKAWTVKGKIYNELALSDFKMMTINPEHKPANPTAAVEAYMAFKKGLTYAEKGYEKKDALNGMSETATYLNPLGLSQYQSSQFKLAYDHFASVLAIDKLLDENGMKRPLATEEDYTNQLYIAGLSALSGDDLDAAKEMFTALKERNYDKPVVYEGLFKVYAESDPEMAGQILEEGRQKFPEDTGLLFAQINYYLQKGEMDKLLGRLELAIEKEPNNSSLYTTLGSVYDNLYQSAELNSEKATEYFNKAKMNYEKALEVSPGDFTATYSIGALYYNKAAKVVEEMNELANDLSKEGMKKYDMKKVEMEDLFDQALPYFIDAETMDNNDKNTLIALKEIYARVGDISMSNYYKAKLDGSNIEKPTPKYVAKKRIVTKNVPSNNSSSKPKASTDSEKNIVIQMNKRASGTYEIPCKVNGLDLKFVFDTGASDVSISMTEALFMLKNNYLTEEDLGEKVYYSIANGNVTEGTKINLKLIEFGGVKLEDVKASIVHELGAPLLLGQSVISRLGTIQIDPIKSTLTIIKQ